MAAMMADLESTYADFMASGRSGRRNALHNILGGAGEMEAAGLALNLTQLEINEAGAVDDNGETRSSFTASPLGPDHSTEKDS